MKDDGGPAFPVAATWRPDGDQHDAGWHGLFLRDWFAGMALSGMVTHAVSLMLVGEEPRLNDSDMAAHGT